MSIKIEKLYDGDYDITIDPTDDEYKYMCIESKRAGIFFLQINKDNMANIITVTERSHGFEYDMNEFWTFPDNNFYMITERFYRNLPTKEKYLSSLN